uniref:Uncharacterized protein n=1 Tax=Rhizophora mucronata TaxID=61149 RepID=A0A2P2QGG4_RHIMU
MFPFLALGLNHRNSFHDVVANSIISNIM